MRKQVRFLPLLICLMALAACGGTAANSSSSTPTPTAQPTPTNTPAASMTVYTSPDGKYQISYPADWQQQTADGNPGRSSFMGPDNQFFEVTDNGGVPGSVPADLVNSYCHAIQADQAAATVETTTVTLAGQTWTKGDCDAGTQSSTDLVVEVVEYNGVVYQMDYASSLANFQADADAFYTPMEQSFKFLS